MCCRGSEASPFRGVPRGETPLGDSLVTFSSRESHPGFGWSAQKVGAGAAVPQKSSGGGLPRKKRNGKIRVKGRKKSVDCIRFFDKKDKKRQKDRKKALLTEKILHQKSRNDTIFKILLMDTRFAALFVFENRGQTVVLSCPKIVENLHPFPNWLQKRRRSGER